MTNISRLRAPADLAARTSQPIPKLTSAASGPAAKARPDAFVAEIDSPQGRRKVLAVSTAPLNGGQPLVFFNADETLSKGELGRDWTATGVAKELIPGRSPFQVAGSHNNASPDSKLKVGVQILNTGRTAMKIAVTTPQVRPGHSLGLPPGAKKTATGYELTIPPGKSVVLPMGSASANTAVNPRTSTQPVAYQATVKVTSGSAADLRVRELACHPDVEGPAKPTYGGDKLHHEGVYLPQAQTSPAVTLTAGNAIQLKTAGSQAGANSHYLTPHRFELAVPTSFSHVTFRNASGGLLRALVNGKELKLAANGAQPVTLRTMTVADAVKEGLLKSTGKKDAGGNPVYELNVTWLPGSNCDLSVYGS